MTKRKGDRRDVLRMAALSGYESWIPRNPNSQSCPNPSGCFASVQPGSIKTLSERAGMGRPNSSVRSSSGI